MGGTEGGPKDMPLTAQPATAAGRVKSPPVLLPTVSAGETDGNGLSPASRIDLDRLAQGMTKTTAPGPVITDVAGALRSGGNPAKKEARYLISELDRLAPQQADHLRIGLTESLKNAPDNLHGAFPEHNAVTADEKETDNRPNPATRPGLLANQAQQHKSRDLDERTQAMMLEAARLGELTTSKSAIDRIQSAYARDDTVLDRLGPELRAFYNAYQMHLRTQPYTTNPGVIATRDRNALIAGREAMGTTKAGPAFAQGALGTVADMINGTGQITGNQAMIDAGRELRKKIENAFHVPDGLRNTGSVTTAAGWGELTPGAALGAGGLTANGLMRAGAAVAAGAAGAGKEAASVARQGASVVEQRIAAFVGAVSEGAGPTGMKLAAKQGARLVRKHLGLNLATLPKAELNILNSALAPQGVKVLANGVVYSSKAPTDSDKK